MAIVDLKKLKQGVKIDQQNILIGVVISNATQTVKVRLPDGRIVDAVKGEELFDSGDQLEIRSNGSVYIVTGPAPLAPLSGEYFVQV
jgi:hypothetical protein